MYTVTTDEAINRGRKILFRGPALVFFGCVALCAAVMFNLKEEGIAVRICFFSSIAITIGSPLLVYLRLLPGWRIWALSNVQNVHEFKRTAILSQIYPEDNSRWWRFELLTQEQKEKLRALAERFNEPDVFEDDYNIPHETTYSYSSAEIAGFALYAVFMILLGVSSFFLPEKKYPLSALMFAFGAFFAYQAYKRWSADGPQLTVSNEGITTPKYGFSAWKEITNEQVVHVKSGETTECELHYTAAEQARKIPLKELMGRKSYQIDHVLRTYRGRYEARRKVH